MSPAAEAVRDPERYKKRQFVGGPVYYEGGYDNGGGFYLSGGAIAGIIIAVLLLIAALISIWCCLKRRKQRGAGGPGVIQTLRNTLRGGGKADQGHAMGPVPPANVQGGYGSHDGRRGSVAV